MRSQVPRLIVLLLLAACWSGCAAGRQSDLGRPVEMATLSEPRRPLILIHGFLGSKLRNTRTHRVAWGTMTNVLLGGDTDDLALALGPDDEGAPGDSLEAFQIYESLWGVDYYSKILRTLDNAGGYTIGDIDSPRQGDNAFVFVYDWRRDIAAAARDLGRAIENLQRVRGDPDERFDLVAHSQGGLIARFYVKYGVEDPFAVGPPFVPTMAGARNVAKVVLVGTPNHGCAESLRILHRGIKKVFRPMRPEVVFTMPAVYEMLPPPGASLFADPEGREMDLDLYDAGTWVREEWSVFSPQAQERLRRRLSKQGGPPLADHNRLLRAFLERSLDKARLFHQALNAPSAEQRLVDYHTFGSDCKSTLKSAMVTRKDGRPDLQFGDSDGRLADILYGPGDGKVPMQSVLGIEQNGANTAAGMDSVRFESALSFCGNHGVLPNHPVFQNSLLYLLRRGDGAAR